MKITQIRNATIIIEYAGKKILVDPFLAPKDKYPAFPESFGQDRRTPWVELPKKIEEIIDVDAVILTHLHLDHFDEAAIESLDKSIPLFAQNAEEAETVRGYGFTEVDYLKENSELFEGIKITKISGTHGFGDKAVKWFHDYDMSEVVSGFVLEHEDEQTLYVAGDTVWTDEVAAAIDTFNPNVIVVNAGDAQIDGEISIIMGKEDVYQTHLAAPEATVVTSHLEAVNHATLSRSELKAFLADKGVTDNVLVPEDGQSYLFEK
ncbi:MBL fold metallo-hydrolase [Staphylococcus gallinarum]|uniref:MBL fold metallo-hydrolase n=1 Tax=Staphylococcus gallinarum TaxID=1293 RepID=A0A418HQ87_STAGA|nr:MBL fold metallo-hydrolase [Staphylococcus gallinarum]MCD8826466.1 MBL fold metallo-hydrolase [Staphylococcus gallinarum]PTE77376.1 hypothetical protein BUY96_06225 [Staphylococcus gallinarum]RIL43323.1 MBL fold metallo-hydrolase [Staphylococcus gallinarum]RIO94747.1 MBL fold metallo-hydrolase [Staphylococcus gallinarum]